MHPTSTYTTCSTSNIQKQQSVPLTPNLKHSNPSQTPMYEEKHVYKRSNSQNEFDFPLSLLDISDPPTNLNIGLGVHVDHSNEFMGGYDHFMSHLDKGYSHPLNHFGSNTGAH